MKHGSVRQGSQCMDTLGHTAGGTVGLYTCHGTGGNQEWSLTKNGNIKHADLCLSASYATEGEKLQLKICDNSVYQVSKKNTENIQLFLCISEVESQQGWKDKIGKIS